VAKRSSPGPIPPPELSRASAPGPTPAFKSAITESPMGSIMMVVAVLLTHMLMAAVATMNPAIRASGRVPATLRTWSAMRRCRFHFSMAMAITKPPAGR
jgi:hypothetical protein